MRLRPLRIALVNMPFAKATAPSLALAQLETVLKDKFGDKVRVDTHYLNMDFALWVGDPSIYSHPYTSYGSMTHAADWFFRQVAFPDTADNADEYLARYYFGDDAETQKIRTFLRERREGLEQILNGYIDTYRLLDADIVGFTLLFSETVASFAMARLLKKRRPNIITLVGGASCEGDTAKVYAERVPQIDYVFSGHAHISLQLFVKHMIAEDVAKCDHINGVLSKTNGDFWKDPEDFRGRPPELRPGQILTCGDELDINTCITPDFKAFLDTFDRKFPGSGTKPMLLFETSRGCKWGEHKRCLFCGLNGPMTHYRAMTPANAIAQIQALYKYVPRAVFFLAADNIPLELFQVPLRTFPGNLTACATACPHSSRHFDSHASRSMVAYEGPGEEYNKQVFAIEAGDLTRALMAMV